MAQFLLKRSGTEDKRPDPTQMVLGELDLNYDSITGGIFYKDSGGGVIKVGPAQVSATAPNATPAGSSGNSPGEFWYNTGDNFLYIWDGSSWATTAPGVGMASPTVPGVVYGLTGDTDLNVALGKGAGSNITTGTCNVAIGPNVAIATATGDCQLAIGFSATSNWLTGDSTKAIQPGAGIIDCALSTGSAGQLLSSTGSNALEWVTPDYISSTALNASSAGALIVNGCDLGGGTCFTAILPGPTEPGQILTNAYNPSDPGYLAGQGYLNWCTPNYISQSSFGPGALVVGCTPGSTGGICTVGTITNANNPGVAVGYYQGVTVTSALTGTGALANVNVINVGYFPSVDSIEITQPGTGYALSETVRFTICGNQITTCASVASLNQTTICKAGYLSVGTNGQVLTVDSTCALGVKWAASSGGSGIPCACITGQGALITGTAANTPTALAVGTAGQVLTVDLACSTGLKWATPSSASAATPTVSGTVLGCTLATGTGATSLGSGALGATPTGTCNVGIGFNAGCSLSTGAGNTAVGANTLTSNTASGCNTAVGFGSSALATGDNNTSVGFCSLAGNSASIGNVAIGSFAMNNNGGGGCNVGIGFSALRSVTSGGRNVAVGENSVRGLTTGGCNVGVGSFSLCSITTGVNNTGVGYAALFAGGDGSNNTAVGANSLCSTGGATNNSAFGVNAGRAITTGNGNTLLGTNAGCSFITGAGNTIIGGGTYFTATASSCNTAVGLAAGQNTTGGCNTFLGAETGCLVSSGGLNTVIGHRVNPPVLTGSCQLAIGFCNTCWLTGCSTGAIRPGAGIMDCAGDTGTAGQVLMSNGSNAICWGTAGGGSAATPTAAGIVLGLTDVNNVAVGCSALLANTGPGNVAVGVNAFCSGNGLYNTVMGHFAMCCGTGNTNTAIGAYALCAVTTGNTNVALGYGAGIGQTGGDFNVIIGTNVNVANLAGSCQLAIGFSGTDNWLTGDSTKAIKPGAGIIDCTGSCGTVGQALLSDGANAVVWGANGAIDINLFCCQNAASCGANGGNLIVGSYGDGSIVPAALNPGTAGQILTISPTCNVNPVRWCTANYLCGACFSKGAIAVGCNQVGGGVGTLTCVAPNNPGVAVGYYPDVAINGGSGTGLTANINIINVGYFNTVDSVEVSNPGTGYLGSNSGMTATINGTTLTTTFSVASLNSNTLFNYSYLAVGSNGQVLTADSACTNGVKWASSPSGIPCSTITAKGALVTGTAANTPASLSVGTDGQILIACNACTTGLTWGPNVSGTVSAATPTAQGIVYGKYDCGTTYPDTAWDYVAYGYQAGEVLNQVNSALNVTAIGNYSMQCSSSWYTTAIGHCSSYNAQAEDYSTFVGYQAGKNSCGQRVNGDPIGDNVYVGVNAGSAACGAQNTYLGANSGTYNVGTSNTYLGSGSGPYFSAICAGAILTENIAIGGGAGASMGQLASVTSGANVFIGNAAGNAATNPNNAIALGVCAQVGVATSNNVSVGAFSGSVVGTGSNNVALGPYAACNLTSAANTIVIGCCAGTTTGGVSGNLTTESNRIVMGNSAHTCAQIQIAWTTVSDVRDKAIDPAGVPYGLLFVENLEPIAYRFCNRETNEVTDEKLRYGFSAQNIRSLEGDQSVIVSDDNPDKLTLTDQHLLPVLVNAIKELSEKNKLLEERIAALEDK